MTDREWSAARHAAPGVATPPPDRADSTSHPDHAPRADAPSMPVTLTARPPGRTAADAPPRPWLARLLAGEIDLPALAPAALPPGPRPAAEYDAVSRALDCPDLFLLDAPDRPARERVVADLARCAALRGERVLILSPDPAAADRLVEMVAADPAVKAVRALGDDENPHRPSPAATRLTTAARGRPDPARRTADADLRAADADLAAAEAVAAVAADLKALADRFAAIEPERAALIARRDDPPAPAPGSAFAADLARVEAEAEAARRPLLADRAALADRRAAADAALAAARQHKADAADPTRKSGFFSRLLHKPKPPADPAELDRAIADAEREAKELADRDAALQADLDAIDRRAAAARETAAAAALVVVRAEIEAALAALAAERDEVAGRFALAAKELTRAGVPAPAQLSPDAAARAAAEAEARRAAAAARRAAARDRLDDLARAAGADARRALADVRVVVGTPSSLTADPAFADPPADPPFAVLVLDHAGDVGEADFVRLAPLAGRWVLAGDAFPAHDRAGPRRPPPLLTRLARRLDRDAWGRDGDRLVARLLPAPGVRHEPLLDHPEFELRFAADGALAAIAFPPGLPAAAAHRFLADELGEARPRPCGPVRWHDAELAACWPPAEAPQAEWVEVGVGVRAKVAGAFTAAVAFDPALGWDRPAAEAWLAARAAAPGRVAALR